MSKQGFTAKCACFISPEADNLIRTRFRRKGDYGRLVNQAIIQTYGFKIDTQPNVVGEVARILHDNPAI